MANLLEKASIVLTPTAYNNGEALCIKPDDGSGDFQFSRNSAATRVNAQGLVENVQILSGNLVQNGSFSEEGAEEVSNGSFTNGSTDWDLGTGWSVADGMASRIQSAAASYLTQTLTIPLVQNKVYKITYTATIPDGNLRPELTGGGGTSEGTLQTASGTYTDYIKAENNHIKFRFRANADFNGSVTNISVKEVGQNWDFGGDWELVNGTAEIQSSTNSFLVQSNVVDLSVKNYKLQYEVITTNGSNFRLAGGSSAFGTITLDTATIGVKTIYLTSNGTARNLQFNQNSFRGSIDDISLIEITDDTNLPRINYEGFSYQDALGSEEIVNGGFDSDTAWSKGAGWSIANGEATHTGSASYLSQSILNPNTQYKVKIKVSQASGSNFVQIYMGGSPASVLIQNVGEYEYIFTSQSSIGLGFALRGAGNVGIDNVSVKEYLGQSVVPDSGCGSWLWEPQSTNLVTYSETYGSGTFFSATSGSTIDNTTSISPSGEANATQVTSTGQGKIQSIALTTLSQNTDYAFSFYAKNVDATFVESRVLAIGGSGGSGLTRISYINELSTENWVRITHYFNTGTHTTFYLYMSNALNSGGTIQLWGAQLEQQSYATSYIPTNGEPNGVTRNQDVCTNGGSLASINSTEGVLYAEIAKSSSFSDNQIAFTLSDGSINNRVMLFFGANSTTINAQVRSNSASYFSASYVLGANATNFNQIAIKYKNNDFSFWVNGVKIADSISGNAPIGLNQLNFTRGDASQNFFGKTKCLAVWKEALSDQELTELTTI